LSFYFLITFLRGVYQLLSGNSSVYHGVKILGWGKVDGTPYWLVANSWGTNWAGLGGFFKILRGRNSAGIELNVMGGTPKV
jgi:cathepsin B